MAQPSIPFFLGAVYAQAKVGKTVSSLRAFSSGLFLGPPNCFAPAQTFLDFSPTVRTIHRLSDLIPIYEHAATKGIKAPSIVVSDVSILAANELRLLDSEIGGSNGFAKFAKMEDIFFKIMEHARKLEKYQLWEFHLEPPKTIEKKGTVKQTVFVPASPQFPGWAVSKNLAGHFDFLGQVIHTEELLTSAVWEYGFATKPDGESVRGDRLNLFTGISTLNIREPLRLRGMSTPRHDSLAWMDSEVDKFGDWLAKLNSTGNFNKETVKEVLTSIQKDLNGRSMEHRRLVMLDSFDRAESIRQTESAEDDLINNLLHNIKE